MKILQRLNYIIGLIPIGALFGLMAFVANVEIKDLDLWLHMGVGKYITLSGNIPQTDIFNIVTTGHFWNNHEWLFQVLVYNIFQTWGEQGVSMMQIVVVTVTMLILLFIGYSRERQLLTTVALMLVYFVYQSRFTIRPDLFSLLFFTIYIFIMSLWIDRKRSLLALVIVQILWTNMHGFFFFGPLFVFIGVFSEWLKRHIRLPYEWNESGRLTDMEYSRLKLALVCVTLSCLVNPQFIHGAIYPITVFFSLRGEDRIFFDYIQELKPPITRDSIVGGGQYAYFKLMIIVSWLSFYLNRRRIDISALFLWIIFLIFSLQAIRNISFFAFAAYLVIITNCYYLSANDVIPIKFKSKKFVYLTGIFAKILLLFFIFSHCKQMASRGYYDFAKYERKSEFGGISQKAFPIKAANFIVENNIKANIFNDFNSGAYLIGRTYPNIKVFMDGRTELYGGKFFREYLKIWEKGNGEVFDSMVEKYNLTGAFLNSSREEIPKDIVKYLNNHEDWIPVYFDHDGIFFLKNVPEHQETISRFKIDFENWVPPKTDLLRIGPVQAEPYHYNFRAFTLEAMDYDDQAIEEAKEALRIMPNYADPLQLIGRIFTKRKQYYYAFEVFRHAALLDPGNKKNRYNLALSYMDIGEYEGAVKQYAALRQLWPADPKAVFFQSKALAFNRQYEESLETLKIAVLMSPKSVGDIMIIADIVFDDHQFEDALEMYQMALKSDGELAKANYKVGLCLRHLNKPDKALIHLKKAQELKPENETYQAALENAE